MGDSFVDLTLSDEGSGGASARRRPRADEEGIIFIESDGDDAPQLTLSNHDLVARKSMPKSSRTIVAPIPKDQLTNHTGAAYDANRQMARSTSNGAQEPKTAAITGTSFPPLSDPARGSASPRQRQRPRDEPNYWKDKKAMNGETSATASQSPSSQPSPALDNFRRPAARSNGLGDEKTKSMFARKTAHQHPAALSQGRPARPAQVGESAPRKRKRSSGESLSQPVKAKGPRLSRPDSLDISRSSPDGLAKSAKTSDQSPLQVNNSNQSLPQQSRPRSEDPDQVLIRPRRKLTEVQDQAQSESGASPERSDKRSELRARPEQENSPSDADRERDPGVSPPKTSLLPESGPFKIPERPASGKSSEKGASAQGDAPSAQSLHSHIVEKHVSQEGVPFANQEENIERPLTLSATEAVLKKYVTELQDDHDHFLRSWLARARKCHEPSNSTEAVPATDLSRGVTKVNKDFIHAKSPFNSIKPVSTHIAGKTSEKGHVYLTQDVMFDKSTNHKSNRSYLSVRITYARHETLSMPDYTSYVGLKRNVLAENEEKLLYWPYMGENADEAALHEEIVDKFSVSVEERDRRLQQSAQAQKYHPYVQDFLAELGCSMNDVLRFLLEQSPPSTIQSTENVRQAVLARNKSCEKDFDRSTKRWVLLLSKLPPSSDSALASAALACQAFLSVCKFSIWQIARHNVRQTSEPQDINDTSALEKVPNTESDFEYRELACRICHIHNCPYHGEYRESPPSDADDDDSDAHSMGSELSLDVQEASRINFKKLVKVQSRHNHQHDEESPFSKPALPRRGYSYWIQKSSTHLLHDRQPFYPCSHEGTCEQAQCRCFEMKITCEKTCACPPDCERRYRGCQCAQKGKVCFQNPTCDCYRLNRECDADLCGTCGAAEVLDPVNRYNKEVTKGKCANVHIQRNLPKRTLLGNSEVQGFGLYMGESVKAHEYIGEYKGEVITKNEADRRGAIYAHLATNYLFSLNKGQEVDSTKAGNKMRFVNNSEREDTINCYAQTMLCNSVTRIGMYARRDIAVGEELFFNYGYPKVITKHFWEKGEKPKKLSGTSRGKWRASTAFISDEEGPPTGSGTGKATGKKEKYKLDKDGKLVKRKSNAGGARPGAGRKPKHRPHSSANIGIIPPNPSTSSVTQLKEKGKGKSKAPAIESSPPVAPMRRAQDPRPRKKVKGWVYDDEIERSVFEHRDEMDEEEEAQAGAGAEDEVSRALAGVQDSDEDSDYHEDEEEELPRRRRRRGWRQQRKSA